MCYLKTLSTAKIIASEMPECVRSFGTVILTGKMNYPEKNLSSAILSTINTAMTVRCDERAVTKHIIGSFILADQKLHPLLNSQ
jgi:hypothetical protein